MNKTIFGLIAGVISLGLVTCGGDGDVTGTDAGEPADAPPASNERGAADRANQDAADAMGVGMVDGAVAIEAGRDAATLPSTDVAKDALPDTGGTTIPDTGRDDAGRDTSRDMAMDGRPFDVAGDSPIDGTAPDGAIDAGSVDLWGLGDAEAASDQPKVRLTKVSVYGNCMPIIANDPIIAFWTVEITGAQGSSARLTHAALAVTGSVPVNQVFTVDTPNVPLVNGAGSANQRKQRDSTSYNTACAHLCGDATYQLDLVFSVDGQDIAVSSSGVFGCAV